MEKYSVRNLSFTYPEQAKKALDNIELTVEKGEFIVICGPSGCGKSTLLHHFKSVLSPHGTVSGDILFDGIPLSETDQRRQASEIGFVSQSPDNQIVTDKVWHELAFGLESLGCDTPSIRRRVAEMASFFGMQDWFYKNVTELSGGQKQLLNLGAVMVMQPSVIILDEPTSQLDPIAASDFLAVLAKINRELGVTVILTEHRLEEALPLASRAVVMDGGRIICTGAVKEIGKFLREYDHSMFLAMPAAMRIWAGVENEEECPVTVCDGSRFLSEFAENHAISAVPASDDLEFKGDVVLKAADVWFRYEKDGSDIVKGLEIALHSGELLAILGGNGTGKTTSLKVLAGLRKHYRGDVTSTGKIAVLPQDPKTLFVKKTVREDLLEYFKGKKLPKEEKESRVNIVSELCRLDELLERHPYDISGGEQQRAALAKVLLSEPDILLLDEPTKGLDAEFKAEFADIIGKLLGSGKAVLMVSHDIEFCAEYADRCAMFFNGEIVAQGTPREFFSGSSFYTTSANRIARHILPGAVTVNDVVSACGGKTQIMNKRKYRNVLNPVKTEQKSEHNKPLPLWRKLTAAVSGIAALGVFMYAAGITDLTKIVNSGGMTALADKQIGIYSVLIISLIIMAFSVGRRSELPAGTNLKAERGALAKRTSAAAVMILIAIPLTLFIGVFYLGIKKYNIVALAVLIECMMPFFMIFESRRPKPRELVVIASLCAIGVAGRAAFFMLPQFKPVMALTIIAGVAFGGETGFLVGAVTMLASNVLFSQGPWTPWQMFSMGIIGFIAGVLFRKGFLSRSRASLCIFGALSAIVIYGGIMNPASALIWSTESINKNVIIAYYLTGFPMDCIHAFATVFFLYFAAEPMLEKLDRIKVKYGLNEN
ncbi:MAG: ATP-binding cassette domain-containing protein [Alistipes sp.]|nr:ATP-binding cassette domain-containing protein [Alistipes sp.]